ncbi:Sister chromatid cohesion protein 2 [Ascosphaera aggregata]|nr:Sister chromatid cohesion protein 2 [Ascosphaera aggregata]
MQPSSKHGVGMMPSHVKQAEQQQGHQQQQQQQQQQQHGQVRQQESKETMYTGDKSQRPYLPLPVEHALRYSPMTNPPAFGLSLITRPDIRYLSSASEDLPQTYDQHVAGEIIDRLDDQAQKSASSVPEDLNKTVRYLQSLLDSDGLTQFKFKHPSRKDMPKSYARTPVRDGTDSPLRDNLGPFAKLMLDNINVPYRFSSPKTPNAAAKKEKAMSKSLPTPLSSSKPIIVIPTSRTEPAHKKESSTPSQTSVTGGSGSLTPFIMVPNLPSTHQTSQYIHIPDQNMPPKRRKLNPEDEQKLASLHVKDHRQEIDAALVTLQDLLYEIFEAEDEIEINALGEPGKPPSNIFIPASKILSSETHHKLHRAIERVNGYKRLRDIPKDYLRRLQKLCEVPILNSQAEDLTIEQLISNPDRLSDVHNGLMATCTFLRSMSGEHVPHDLCPEDMIQQIPHILTSVFDGCIIPVIEARPGDKAAALWTFATTNAKQISSLCQQTRKILMSLAKFLTNVDVAENITTSTEFLAAKLIFVENALHDKDSALGFQKFESVRRAAMDVLARIFAKYVDQRSVILDEILVSLEKLPSTRQSARQFKLIDGKNIQLVSALVMQLVQTTTLLKAGNARKGTDARQVIGNNGERRINKKSRNRSRTDSDDELQLNPSFDESETSSEAENDDGDTPMEILVGTVDPLYGNAVHSARYITKFIVQRAMTSTKTGDQPYRNLLDLFTEDLLSVLGSTDWPSAELLLRVLASQMVSIAEHDKSLANAKNMALELLGWMGSSIAQLTSTASHLAGNIADDDDPEMSKYLKGLYDDYVKRILHPRDLVVDGGPHKIVLTYLQERDLGSWQLSSAKAYILAQWAKSLTQVYYGTEKGDASDAAVEDLCRKLESMLRDPRGFEAEIEMDRASTSHARLAYTLTVLNSPFCNAFDTIVKVLLNSITSDQAKVRSRSLKSVVQMLERDPNLLDRDETVMALILRCAADTSPMVRDSALSLIAKCIALKPKLEEVGCRAILACSTDQTVSVRKRCLGLMKDIYVQTQRDELKIAIAGNLLGRITDFEDSVATLAKQVLEEVWFVPFHGSIEDATPSPHTKVAKGKLIDLIVSCVQSNELVLSTLGAFLRGLLSKDTKGVTLNFKVCRSLVAAMFDRVIEDPESSQALFSSITVFAKANPRLFTPDQLETLHPYIGHLATADDLLLFRSVVVIYRCVLPYLTTSHDILLRKVQNDLFKSISKLARTELNEVMACLWTIDKILNNTTRLFKLLVSVLKGIKAESNTDFNKPEKAATLNKAKSYIRIAGCVGKHCDLEKFQEYLRQEFPCSNPESVAGMIADYIAPFAYPKHPLELRVMALESLGGVCQTWPAQFSRALPRKALCCVFEEDDPSLQNIVLRAFLEFFSIHEGRTEKLVDMAAAAEAADPESNSRFGGSLKASDNDGAAAFIAQNFLKNMLHAALSKETAYVLTAIELIASTNRQGLIHPKECAGVLVSLETSPHPKISKIAFDTHQMLHSQHESMFDREYMRAVQEAFYYQKDVIGDPNGATENPHKAKLGPLFEIVNTSNAKYQKKFLTNLCSKVDFDLQTLDVSKEVPDHLLFAKFICQNLAFFEYAQMAELVVAIDRMEKIVATTGDHVNQTMETHLFLPAPQPPEVEGPDVVEPPESVPQQVPANPDIDPELLRKLATGSVILLMLWEARKYLRRLYNVSAHQAKKKEAGGKLIAKDQNRAPTKVNGVTGDRFWYVSIKGELALTDRESMVAVCRDFAGLLAIDDELNVVANAEDEEMGDLASITEDAASVIVSPTKKRKSAFAASGGIVKRAKSKATKRKDRSSVNPDEDPDL